MKIAFYSNDFKPGNVHLMPWRTMLEVSSSLHSFGHSTNILSGVSNLPADEWTISNVRVLEICKPKDASSLKKLEIICNEEKIDVLYWPLDWRHPRQDILSLEKTGLRVAWYIPGSWYGFGQVLVATLCMHSKSVLPYIAQIIGSRRRFVKNLIANGIRPLITMSDYTREKLVEYGYPSSSVLSILPGKAALLCTDGSPTLFNKWNDILIGNPYFLFFGPPQKIRGIQQILSAFEIVARQHSTVRLVCLFRSDPGLDTLPWKRKIEQLNCKDRILCAWESVGPVDLDAFLKNSYAVLKPFLLVPSEIPLAVIETAGYGKPVIGTGPDGTGNFVKSFGLTVSFGQSKKLAKAMIDLLSNQKLYIDKCLSAKQVYENHHTWDEVAIKWLKAAQK
ncbi:MAG: glycosyltransferase family 4 protein [Geobacteraceae bacterium]|nr:glycosyltransferase family 4 protein [Geobacteraceae bacterium]